MAYRELQRITLVKHNINYKNTGAILLFTTPPEAYASTRKVYIEATNVGTSPTSGTFSIGTNSTSYNNILTSTSSSFTNGSSSRINFNFGTSIPQNTDIYMNITSSGTATGNYILSLFMEMYIYSL